MARAGDDHSARVARTAALTIFSIVLAHTLVETARDALFLAALPPTRLPWVYGLIAILTLASRQASRRLFARLHGTTLLRALLFASAAITVAFWFLTAWPSPWIVVALYVWPAIFAGLVIIEFWRLLADGLTTIEAKTVFSRVGGGAAAGGLAGGIVALGLSVIVETRHLLLAAGIVLVTTAGMLRADDRPDDALTPQVGSLASVGQGMLQISAHPYLRRVFGLLLTTSVLITLVDYIFKSAASAVVAPANLDTLFASASIALNLAGMLVQLTLAERLVRWVGVVRTAGVLPATLSAAAVGVAVQGGVVLALVMKTLDGALRNSIHRTATELFYVPMTADVRASVKGVSDVVAQRGGQLAGSGLILAAVAAGGGERLLAATVAGLSIASLVTVSRLRQPYLDLFRRTLHLEAVGTLPAYRRLNVRSIAALISALGSEDEREVLAAMSLLAEGGQPGLLPGVMVFHPSRAVVLHALDLFARQRRTGLEWTARRLFLEHPDDDVRASALRAQLAVLDDSSVLESVLDDRSAVVRATAVVGLISRGQAGSPPVAAALAALRADADPAPQLALARAIRLQPSTELEALLLELAAINHPEVQLACASAIAERSSPRFLAALLDMLSNRALRPIAREGLVRIGPPALTFLSEALNDRTTPFETRLHIPRSISRFPAEQAMPILLRELSHEEDGVLRFKIIRGLGRLRADAPDARIDDSVLEETLRESLKEALRLKHWHAVMAAEAPAVAPRADGSRGLLSDLLADEGAQAVEIVFRLLDLRYRTEKFEHVFHGLHGSPVARASSLELIGQVIASPWKQAILALTDTQISAPPFGMDEALYQAQPLTEEQVTAEIIMHAPGALRVIASRYAGERGFIALRDSIARVAAEEPAAFRPTLGRSLALLDRGSHAA